VRRAGVALALLGGWLALLAAPAAADPAGPTNYDSVLLEVTAADGEPVPVDLEILGGDAFLVLRAEPGVEVEVPGYEGEPYLRIAGDGTVEQNERSPARWLNEAQLGAAEVEVPPHADAESNPVWQRIGDDGEFAWHDHRIHWMSASAPPQVDTGARESQPVMGWEVGFLVDGREVVATGELHWHPGPRPVQVVGLLAVTLAAGLALAFVRRVPAPVIAGVGALPAVVAGLLPALGLPTGADVDPALILLPPLAILVAGLGLRLSLRDPGALRGRVIGGAAGLPLLVWGVLQAGALTRPIVPGPLPVGVVRGAGALALGLGAATLAVLARDLLQATPGSLDHLSDEPDDPGRSNGPGQSTEPDEGRCVR
jgi:hypothetical protein